MYEPLQPKADEGETVVEGEAEGEAAAAAAEQHVEAQQDAEPVDETAPVNINTARAASKDALIDDGE